MAQLGRHTVLTQYTHPSLSSIPRKPFAKLLKTASNSKRREPHCQWFRFVTGVDVGFDAPEGAVHFQSYSGRARKPRQFSLFPISSLKWRYIHINYKTLCIMSSQKYPKNTYREQVNAFHCVCDPSVFGYNLFNDVVDDREGKLNYTAQSDNHGRALQFVRQKAVAGESRVLLQPEEFKLENIAECLERPSKWECRLEIKRK